MGARKVCMVTYGPSAETLPPLLHEATSLTRSGFVVEALFGAAPAVATDQIAPGFTSHRFPVRTRALFWALFGKTSNRVIAGVQNLVSFVEFTLKAFFRALSVDADIYEAHDLPALLPTVLAARLRGKPVLYRANEIFSETHAKVRFAGFWRWLDRLLVPLCDAVISPDEFRGRIYQQEFGARQTPLTVRNCPPWRPPLQSTKLRDELSKRGIAARTIVLYQGLMDPMRCIEEIAEATKYFDEGMVLVMMGHGFGAWSNPAEKLAGYGRVVVLPRVPYEELPAYTASADMGLLLYRNDCRNNFYCAPNKLFEYMMMGLPMIAPKFPGLVPVVEGGGVGLCVDPADPKDIAAAVNRLARDPALRQSMSANGLRLSRERYNWEVEFARLLERYRALAPGEEARPVKTPADAQGQ